MKEKLIKGNDSKIMVGPEGGFSQNELDLAKIAKFVPVSLAKSRLRNNGAHASTRATWPDFYFC